MGMYDTFWGEYKCPECGTTVKFAEQTKDYGRVLENFYLGDYIDRGNRNYFYEFEYCCPKCHFPQTISLAIRRGQYVGVFFKYEADEINIMDLENIEDGYQRHRIYDKKCEEKLGFESLKQCDTFEQKHVGEYIDALRTHWKIEEVYKEELTDKPSLFYMDNFIYRVSDGPIRRILSVRKNGFTHAITAFVQEGDLVPKENLSYSEQERKYNLQIGCKLVRLE